jgi:hypothetical protein
MLRACTIAQRGWPELWRSYDSSPALFWPVRYQRSLSGMRMR